MKKGLLKIGLYIVLANGLITGGIKNSAQVSANEQNNIIRIGDAEKIAWYHVLSTISLGDDVGMWSYDMYIKNEQKIYNIDNIVNAYCIEYTNNTNEKCGYIIVGASENYAPIIEYATNGSFCSQDENIYYIGNGDINYYVKNNDDNLQNISGDNSIIIETDEIKTRKTETEQENYSDEWEAYYNFNNNSLTDTVEKIENFMIQTASSNPPTSGDVITRPFDFESSYSNYEVVDVPGYNLNGNATYFSTLDFNYDGHCTPTAGTNLMLYWYNKGNDYNSLCYDGSWNSTFVSLYKLMKTTQNGTYTDNATDALIKYLNNAGKSPLVDYYDSPNWTTMSTELKYGYPFLFTVYNHYRYGNHTVLALGYISFTYSTVQTSTGMLYSRYLRIVDGWAKTYNRYVHVKVGHDYMNRDMIRVRI